MTIAEISVAARKLGMTYGQYVHKFHPPGEKIPVREQPMKCAWCGAPIITTSTFLGHSGGGKARKYCSSVCSQSAFAARQKTDEKMEVPEWAKD